MRSDTPSQRPDPLPRIGFPDGLTPSPEQRRLAAMHFERASQLVAGGSYDHGIRLLRTCCRLEPSNLLYRQALRRAEKAKYRNNLRGGFLAWLFSWPARRRLQQAQSAGRYLDVLHIAERILARNPWDVPAQKAQAQAAETLGLIDLAVWSLEQARHKDPNEPELNRRLARLYQKRGNFTQALTLWDLVLKAAPSDEEAHRQIAGLPQRDSKGITHSSAQADADPLEEEVNAIRSQIQQDPRKPGPYRSLAKHYREAGRLEQAHSILLEGLAATSQAFELTVELADLQIEPFRQDLHLTRHQLEQQPSEDLLSIEQKLIREINTRELDLFRLLADRFPAQAHYRYEVAIRLLRGGQIDEAMSELQGLLVNETLRGDALAALGWCYWARNNFRQAQRHFEEAVTCLPADPPSRRLQVLYELARCHAELGELPQAVDVGAEVVRLDPQHRDMPLLLQEWQFRVQQVS